MKTLDTTGYAEIKNFTCATDAGKLNALQKEQEELQALLEQKMERWEYLEELAEKIKN